MERYVICENRKCRFILDSRVNGKSLDSARLLINKCPACGGSWSSTCPACRLPLAITLVGGLPHTVCCDRKPLAKARAA
jgi:hypothetical protein